MFSQGNEMETPISKKDLATVDRDLESELDALSPHDIRRLAKQALRVLYYDRVRCSNYNRENRDKRREYYFNVTKPKRAVKAGGTLAPNARVSVDNYLTRV